MPNRKHQSTCWNELRKLDLCQGVDSLGDYILQVTKGEADAYVVAFTECTDIPTLEYIQRLHRTMFVRVYPWAGQFNKKGDDIWFGGLLSCDPAHIEHELNLLSDQTRELLADASNDAGKCRALAFYHAKFERIHPFKDGNGRVGRMIMESQLTHFFGSEEYRKPFNSHDYHAAIRRAQFRSDIRPLTNLILEGESLSLLPRSHDQIPFSFQMKYGTWEERRARRREARNRII
ncbi:MAG: Fic family protein [Chthoniobacteraceae bacterium]